MKLSFLWWAAFAKNNHTRLDAMVTATCTGQRQRQRAESGDARAVSLWAKIAGGKKKCMRICTQFCRSDGELFLFLQFNNSSPTFMKCAYDVCGFHQIQLVTPSGRADHLWSSSYTAGTHVAANPRQPTPSVAPCLLQAHTVSTSFLIQLVRNMNTLVAHPQFTMPVI